MSLFDTKYITFQLVTLVKHHFNSTKCAICTYKTHLIVCLCSTDPKCSIHILYHLLPQALLALNILRASCANPDIFSYTQFNGAFDKHFIPMVPPRISSIFHEKPSTLNIYIAHGVEFY